MATCPSVLSVNGKCYACVRNAPHPGEKHAHVSNRQWSDPPRPLCRAKFYHDGITWTCDMLYTHGGMHAGETQELPIRHMYRRISWTTE